MEAPKINCPDNVDLPTAPGTSSALYDYDTPMVTDNSGETITPVTTDVPSNKQFPIGSNVYLYIAEDSSGNQGFCSFSVNVIGLCCLFYERLLLVVFTIINDIILWRFSFEWYRLNS